MIDLYSADFDQIKYHDWFAAIIVSAFGKYVFSEEIEAVHRQHENNASPLYFLKKFPMGFGCFEEIIFIQETQENLIDFFCLKWMMVKKKYAHYLLMKNIA